MFIALAKIGLAIAENISTNVQLRDVTKHQVKANMNMVKMASVLYVDTMIQIRIAQFQVDIWQQMMAIIL